jgi:hypothetical protein
MPSTITEIKRALIDLGLQNLIVLPSDIYASNDPSVPFPIFASEQRLLAGYRLQLDHSEEILSTEERTSDSPYSSFPNQTIEVPADRDIVVQLGRVDPHRPANKDFHEILKHDVMIYKTLVTESRSKFASNLYHFHTRLQARRFLHCRNESRSCEALEEDSATSLMEKAMQQGAILRACCRDNGY